MVGYLIRRILYCIPLLFVIAFISFVVITLPPGDYMSTMQARLTQVGGLSLVEAQKMAEQLRQRYGLDKPFLVQFGKWLLGIFRGDFGFSFRYRKPVADVIWERLGWTLLITVCAMVLSAAIGVLCGIYSATHQYSLGDFALSIFAVAGLSIPNFFLALALMYILITYGHSTATGGLFSPEMVLQPWSWAKLVDLFRHIWLPIVVVGVAGTARSMRVIRANLLDVLGAQYVQVARAKGLSERIIIWKHAFRNSVQPFIMYMGMTLPWLIQGEMATGIVLSLPTTGTMFLLALQDQDMYLAGSFVLLLAAITVIGNLLADLVLAWVDPRIRYE